MHMNACFIANISHRSKGRSRTSASKTILLADISRTQIIDVTRKVGTWKVVTSDGQIIYFMVQVPTIIVLFSFWYLILRSKSKILMFRRRRSQTSGLKLSISFALCHRSNNGEILRVNEPYWQIYLFICFWIFNHKNSIICIYVVTFVVYKCYQNLKLFIHAFFLAIAILKKLRLLNSF